MSSAPNFLVSLWESVFTPGPTPTLLVATNASFAALQVVLFFLLLATYSVHFVVLSFLCAGLWWSINWFVAELQASQTQDEGQKEVGATIEDESDKPTSEANRDVGHTSDETETEEATPAPIMKTIPGTPAQPSTTARLRPEDIEGQKKRKNVARPSESEGYISTDSEWEKVDQ